MAHSDTVYGHKIERERETEKYNFTKTESTTRATHGKSVKTTYKLIISNQVECNSQQQRQYKNDRETRRTCTVVITAFLGTEYAKHARVNLEEQTGARSLPLRAFSSLFLSAHVDREHKDGLGDARREAVVGGDDRVGEIARQQLCLGHEHNHRVGVRVEEEVGRRIDELHRHASVFGLYNEKCALLLIAFK